jgi:hypothetical protein
MGDVMRCDCLPVPDEGKEIWLGGRQTGGRSRVGRTGRKSFCCPGGTVSRKVYLIEVTFRGDF